ncbi:Nn.00g015370.m01.CDS01 [Neocucurbitaria sp. VM-36]
MTMWPLLLSVPVIFLAQTISAQSGTCYFANGTALPNDPGYNEYQPCTSGPSTICCGINRANPAGGNGSNGFTVDECLPNGLCQNRVTTDGVQKTSFWVDFCADSDVTSSNCLNVCDQVRGAFGNTPLTPCTGRADSDRWCCGDSNACCTSNVGVVRLAQVLGGALSSSIVSSATSRATSSGPTAASSASATASSASVSTASASGTGASAAATSAAAGQSKKTGLSGGAIAGIVIGAIAGLALFAAVLFFARRAAMYKKKAAASNYVEAPANPYPPQYPDQGYVGPGSEKYAQQNQHTQRFANSLPPTELPPAPPSELPSGNFASSAPPLPQK